MDTHLQSVEGFVRIASDEQLNSFHIIMTLLVITEEMNLFILTSEMIPTSDSR